MATLTLDSILELKQASVYSSPKRASDVLPIVYGDMSENSGNQGTIACILLNTTTFTYGLAGHALQSAADGNIFRFFDSDGIEITSGYSVSTSNDYESQGTIAIVDFTSDVGDITGQYNGKANDDGTLMSNPITIFEDIVGGSSALNRTSFSLAEQLADDLEYTAAGVIVAEKIYRVWLNNLAASFLMDWFTAANGELKVRLDSSNLTGLQPAFFLTERETKNIQGYQYVDNLLNQPAINYAISYAQSDRRYREGVRSFYLKSSDGSAYIDTNSQRRYGIQLPPDGAFNFDWTRSDATIAVIQQRLVEKYKDPLWLFQWPEISVKAMEGEIGDSGIYGWEERIDSSGNPVTSYFCQILEKNIMLDSGELGFLLQDTSIPYSADYDLWNGTDATLGDGGTW